MTNGSEIIPLSTHDVIIPAREEVANTLIPTVWAFFNCPLVDRIIVVNDGLSETVMMQLTSLRVYTGGDRLIILDGPREGKGQAVTAGLELVTADRVIFCDGDLHHFTTGSAWLLCGAITVDTMIIGVTEYKEGLYVPWPVRYPDWVAVSGERSVHVDLVRGLDLHGYGMETQINAAAQQHGIPVVPVELHGVYGSARWSERRESEMQRDRKWLKEQGFVV